MSVSPSSYDAVIIGSGPNGLSAGILLAQQGLSVKIFEAKDTIGGGTRTLELTEPGFLHDVCSAVHPTGAGSPFLSGLPLQDFGLEWIHPEIAAAHPLDGGEAILGYRDFDKMADQLGTDAKAYTKLFKPFANHWPKLSNDLFGTLRIPKNPLKMMRFGWFGMFSAKILTNSLFRNSRTKAFFAGMAAHSILPLDKAFSASFGLVLGTSMHAVGWPIAKGGSASVTDAMARYFYSLGGEIETGRPISSKNELPSHRVCLFDVTPYQVLDIMGNELSPSYSNALKKFEYGPGVFKMDFALSEAVPWKMEACKKAGTLHLGGTFPEIAASEKEIWNNKHADKPYVLVAQPSVDDPGRAPTGKHVLWAYCHVPHGSVKECSNDIIAQIERFAPGFRDTIIATSTMTAMNMQTYNANYLGGDINGGAQTVKQLFARPVLKWNPHAIPVKGNYICSSSTPPGGGVHGMCGFHAARSALKKDFGINL